ncbi:acyltransferase family protein [Elizabethkingia anophelis]|uniref:acyltransferase family protein n=1 Tax=Elizabethkingia anophelis TaxID=1117645 RepID=UPI0011BF90FA
MNQTKRIYQIDLLRFIAAFSVVMFHYSYVAYKRNDISFLSFPEISQYSKYGYLGVYLFFIISGFVIAFSSRHLSLKKFLYSRFMRLYPMFWICMFITFVVSYFFWRR